MLWVFLLDDFFIASFWFSAFALVSDHCLNISACAGAWQATWAFGYNKRINWANSADEPAEVCLQCHREVSIIWNTCRASIPCKWDAWFYWWKWAPTGLCMIYLESTMTKQFIRWWFLQFCYHSSIVLLKIIWLIFSHHCFPSWNLILACCMHKD